jgi:hypothetical protein
LAWNDRRKRIGSIEKGLSASALAGPVKTSAGEAGGTKAASLQAHPVPTPDLLNRAYNYVERYPLRSLRCRRPSATQV